MTRRRSLMMRLRMALREPVHQLQLSIALLVMLVGVGTVGYMLIEGLDPLDALYMTIITLTTVGYGELQPPSEAGKAFTIGLIVVGVGVAAWAVSNAAELMLGQTFWTSVARRRMSDQVGSQSDHYVVCGYGRLGRRIVRDLQARGESLVVLDSDDSLEAELLEHEIPHIIRDATLDESLEDARIRHARGLVSALDSDASNVLTVLTAREKNPRLLIVARANTEASESKLRRAGADRVITPEAIGGHRLALALLRPAVHDFFSHIFNFEPGNDVDVGQVTVQSDSPFAGQTIEGCDLRRIRNLSILAVRAADGTFDLTPTADHVIKAGDTLILIGPSEAVYDLEAVFGSGPA